MASDISEDLRETAPGQIDDKRRARRDRVLLAGKVVYGDFSADCTIRDLTPTGARIRLAGQQVVPADFHLIVLRDGVAHRAHTCWLRHPDAGLAFEATHDLGDAADSPVSLRILWGALSPRTV